MHADAPSPERPSRHVGPYRRLLLGAALSSVGDGVTFVALPLLLVHEGASATEVGAFLATLHLPRLLAPLAGAVADRVSRRQLLVVADLLRALSIAGVALLADAGGTFALVAMHALAFAVGCGDVLHDAAAPAYLPVLVDEQDLERANGTLLGVETVSGALIGPPIGALLFTAWAQLPLLVDGVTFLTCALLLWTLPKDAAPGGTGEPLVASTVTSFRWLFAEPRLVTLVVASAAMTLVFSGLQTMLVFYAREALGLSELAYGALLGVFGVGGLLAGVALGRLVERFGMRGVLVASPIVLASAVLALVLSSWLWLVGAALFVGGAAIVSWSAAGASLRQRIVPNEMLGRLSSVFALVTSSMLPAGALLAGLLVKASGVRETFAVGAALAAAAALFVLVRTRGVVLPAAVEVRQGT